MGGRFYHRTAGEAGLKFEDFVEAGCFCLPQLVFCHFHHKADCAVSVVFLVVCDQRGDLLCAIQHRLQNILLVALKYRMFDQILERGNPHNLKKPLH